MALLEYVFNTAVRNGENIRKISFNNLLTIYILHKFRNADKSFKKLHLKLKSAKMSQDILYIFDLDPVKYL